MAESAARKPRRESIAELRARLNEAEETLHAIRSGAVDALVVNGPNGEQVFSLKGADQIYRILVEAMNEGAVSLDYDGMILYSNSRFAEMIECGLERVLGSRFSSYVLEENRVAFESFLRDSRTGRSTREIQLRSQGGAALTVLVSANPLPLDDLPGICVVITDITERKRMELAVREASRGVMDAQERERHRVARELHDGISQLLASARHRLAGIEQMNGELSGHLRAKVTDTRQVLERTIQEVRLISRNLRPSELDDLGLVPALRTLLDEVEERTGLKICSRLDINGVALPQHIELIIYRVVQECLNNVERHAHASTLKIHLGRERKCIRLVVADNGVGFDPRQRGRAGLGLLNIQERAAMVGGNVAIKSIVREGTTITLELPLEIARADKN
jgi:PAS domain S-box-containing protein